MIEVTISNKEMASAQEGMLDFILGKLESAGVPGCESAGVPGCTCVPGQAIKPSEGILMYNRNSMNQASVYTWQSDDYVKAHGNAV
jgi:hypothetical protein